MRRRSKLPKLKKGMHSEQIAILYLIEQGFFVFKNLHGLGPADLIAILLPCKNKYPVELVI